MARKKKNVESREALLFQLDSLQQYIAHHERKLDQFAIDLKKIELTQGPSDVLSFVERVQKAIIGLWTADPRKTVFERELAKDRAALNAEYRDSEECAKIKQGLRAAGDPAADDDHDFDYLIRKALANNVRKTGHLIASIRSTEDLQGFGARYLELMEQILGIFDCALDPARSLRARWLEALGVQTSPLTGKGKPRKKTGRPKDLEVAQRNARMVEAWDSKQYKTFRELGRAFDCSKDTARKAIANGRRKRLR